MILFLDLDGTVRRPKSGKKFIDHPHDQELIPGVVEAIAAFRHSPIVGITNQAGVAKGFKTLKNCIDEQRFTLSLIPQMQSVLFCPDFEGAIAYRVYPDSCWDISSRYLNLMGTYRKPNPGMINHVLISNEADPTGCLMVGDRPEDEAAAAAANVQFLSAEQWRNQEF